jgi:flagellar assembly factor FliW
MLINTKHFGEIEIDETKIITFRNGLPGFENVKKFVVLSEPDSESVFCWLQSVDEPNLAFVILDPFIIIKDYELNLNRETLKELEIEKEEDVIAYSIVVVPADINKMSINLQAPLIINARNHKGMQLILDTDRYGVRHYILDELKRQEGAANACSDKKKGSINCNK